MIVQFSLQDWFNLSCMHDKTSVSFAHYKLQIEERRYRQGSKPSRNELCVLLPQNLPVFLTLDLRSRRVTLVPGAHQTSGVGSGGPTGDVGTGTRGTARGSMRSWNGRGGCSTAPDELSAPISPNYVFYVLNPYGSKCHACIGPTRRQKSGYAFDKSTSDLEKRIHLALYGSV